MRRRHIDHRIFHRLAGWFFVSHAGIATYAFIWNRPMFEFIALFYVVVNAAYTTAATHFGAMEASKAQEGSS